jgi:hypothetical protein
MKLVRACLVAEKMERENSIILCFLAVLNENPLNFIFGGLLDEISVFVLGC